MRIDDIRFHLHVHPFRPIRVFVSDGSYYDVFHHDFMMVSRSEVIIGLSQDRDELPDKKTYIDPVNITRIEPINETRAKSNGQKRPR
jgi:hypothetical protein